MEHPDQETQYEVVKDQELIAELKKAIEEKEWVKDGFGTKFYHANGYQIEESNVQGTWAQYALVSLTQIQD